MNEKIAIETFGNVTKEEHVITLEHNIRKGTFVVEQLEAFPGYHHAAPSKSNVGHVFLLLKNPIEVMDLMRISKKISKYSETELNAVVGEITFENKKYPCIRVKNLKNYEQIEELQSWFYDAGILFAKTKKVKAKAIIKLKKSFYIEQVTDNIYHDLNDEKQWYLAIDDEMSWKLFKKITQVVKNNLSNLNFDAALTGIYRKFGFIDTIRVFTEDANIENLQAIANTYKMVCKKYI